jgi:hypothetical protein
MHSAALKRLRVVRADITVLAKVARPARLTAAQRRSYAAYYESLFANAGYRLDAAYEQGTAARDRVEAARAPAGSRIARERRADDVLLRTIGG